MICVIISFLVIIPTLINFIILCELLWISIYNIIIFTGIECASLTYIIYGLLILCLATAESVIGLTIVTFKFILYGSVNFKKKDMGLKNIAYNDILK